MASAPLGRGVGLAYPSVSSTGATSSAAGGRERRMSSASPLFCPRLHARGRRGRAYTRARPLHPESEGLVIILVAAALLTGALVAQLYAMAAAGRCSVEANARLAHTIGGRVATEAAGRREQGTGPVPRGSCQRGMAYGRADRGCGTSARMRHCDGRRAGWRCRARPRGRLRYRERKRHAEAAAFVRSAAMTHYIHSGLARPARRRVPAAGHWHDLYDGTGGLHALTTTVGLGIKGRSGVVAALTIAAMLHGLRIGDAQNPGPWPADEIGTRRSGWRVSGSLDAHLASVPCAGRARVACAFDDPDGLGDVIEPGYGDEDWAVGLLSTAPPSDMDIDGDPLLDLHGDTDDGGNDCAIVDEDSASGTGDPNAAAVAGCGAQGDEQSGAVSYARTFRPSKTFMGPVAAMVFKTGVHGTGYYADTPPMVRGDVDNPRPEVERRGATTLLLDDLVPHVGGELAGTAEGPPGAELLHDGRQLRADGGQQHGTVAADSDPATEEEG